MSKLIVLDESVVVQRPLHEVYAYVSEFSRIEEWDPAVAAGHKLTPGAPAVGSEYQIDMKAGFSLRYRMIELEQDSRMLMDVTSRLFTAREEIIFSATEGGTRIRYIAKFNFPAALATVNRLYPSAMEKIGKDTMLGLRRALEAEFPAPPKHPRHALADKLFYGVWRFTRFGYKDSRKRWLPMSAFLGGRHIVITGATSGVGLAAAKELAAMGASITLVARDRAKSEATALELAEQSGNAQIMVEICDLGIMAEVHQLADRLLQAGKPIDVLINNAGALFNPRQETKEGLEKSYAVMLLAPYILTERLQPLLAKAGNARVVNVLSGGMYTQKIDVDDLQNQRGSYSGSVAYARAKRGLMILTESWAEKWKSKNIVVNAMHPGWADTPGVADALPAFRRITRSVLRTPEQGADTIVWLAAANEAGKVSGLFWLDREPHISHISKRTRELPEERERLLQSLREEMEIKR